MARGNNQKLKLLYLAKIFTEKTDEEHGLTMPEIIRALEEYQVAAERKALYLDIAELQSFGFDIISEAGNHSYVYKLCSKDFQLAELKLLVDSVQSAKFITEKKSRELIKKLESLVSIHEAKQLQRQVIISGRVKTANESILYNVDTLHTAIATNSQITFQYYQWNVRKEMILRHDGSYYQISPWALIWDDEYYYLVGYDREQKKMKHYRVDKMLHLSILEEKRDGQDVFEKMDIPRYSRSLFGMFGGDEVKVTMECSNAMASIMIDRFGMDIPFVPIDPDHFRFTVMVTVSEQFLGWVIAMGSNVRLTGPDHVVEQMREKIRTLTGMYLTD